MISHTALAKRQKISRAIRTEIMPAPTLEDIARSKRLARERAIAWVAALVLIVIGAFCFERSHDSHTWTLYAWLGAGLIATYAGWRELDVALDWPK